MLEYASNKFGTWRRVDVHSLYLEDGRNANDLTVWELQPLLEKLNIPHVKPGMAKNDLLFAYGCWQQQQREAIAGDRTKPTK
jgi:hypothetical protein